MSAASSTSKLENTMIKPHGSDELNPLFVYDSEKRHALVAEAESLPSRGKHENPVDLRGHVQLQKK